MGSSQKSYRLFYAINIQMSYRFFYSTFKSHTILFSCQFNFQMSYRFFLVNLHISYKKYSLKIKPQLTNLTKPFQARLRLTLPGATVGYGCTLDSFMCSRVARPLRGYSLT